MTNRPAKTAHASFAALIAAIQPPPKPIRCPGTKHKPKPTCGGREGGRGVEIAPPIFLFDNG